MGNLLQGFINQAVVLATSLVLLMAIMSVVRAWWRAGAQVTMSVVGAVVLAGFVIWGVLNFTFLSRITDKEAIEIEREDNEPLLEPDYGGGG